MVFDLWPELSNRGLTVEALFAFAQALTWSQRIHCQVVVSACHAGSLGSGAASGWFLQQDFSYQQTKLSIG